jgi:hypothetical protein
MGVVSEQFAEATSAPGGFRSAFSRAPGGKVLSLAWPLLHPPLAGLPALLREGWFFDFDAVRGFGMFMIVGLTGPAGVGKDTAAEILAANLGYSTMAFADPIRIAAARYYGCSLAELELEKRANERVRRLLQVIGDHGRAMHPDLYIDGVRFRLGEERAKGAPGAIISDVRLHNEAAFVRREAGGTLIHLQRDGVRWAGNHALEHGVNVEPEDLVVRNPGTIGGFRGELLGTLVDVLRRAVA